MIAATERQRQDEAAARKLAYKRDLRRRFDPICEPSHQDGAAADIPGADDRLLTVELADAAWDAPDDERNRLVKRAIREHYSRRRGEIPTFGSIWSYYDGEAARLWL